MYQLYGCEGCLNVISHMNDLKITDVNVHLIGHLPDLVLVADQNGICNLAVLGSSHCFEYCGILCNGNGDFFHLHLIDLCNQFIESFAHLSTPHIL